MLRHTMRGGPAALACTVGIMVDLLHIACFAEVIAPRQDDARNNLHELSLFAFCTILAGGKDCSDTALFGGL